MVYIYDTDNLMNNYIVVLLLSLQLLLFLNLFYIIIQCHIALFFIISICIGIYSF